MDKKRFTIMKKFDGSYVICDKVEMLVADDCCDLLNELFDENNILNENEDDLKECTIENINLKKENERLRKDLDNFKPVMFQDVRKGTVIILYSKGDIDE